MVMQILTVWEVFAYCSKGSHVRTELGFTVHL